MNPCAGSFKRTFQTWGKTGIESGPNWRMPPQQILNYVPPPFHPYRPTPKLKGKTALTIFERPDIELSPLVRQFCPSMLSFHTVVSRGMSARTVPFDITSPSMVIRTVGAPMGPTARKLYRCFISPQQQQRVLLSYIPRRRRPLSIRSPPRPPLL